MRRAIPRQIPDKEIERRERDERARDQCAKREVRNQPGKHGEEVDGSPSHRTVRGQVGHDGKQYGAYDQRPLRRPAPALRDSLEEVRRRGAGDDGPDQENSYGDEQLP